MRMLSVSTSLSKVFQRVATVHIATIAVMVVICVFLVGQAVAQTPDGTPPSQETICSGLSGAAFGLCNAYCEAQDCDVSPQPSCKHLRKQFEKVTGSTVFPCDIPPSCEKLNPTQEQIDKAIAIAITGINDPWGQVADFQLFLDRVAIQLRCTLEDPTDDASAQILRQVLPQQSQTCAADGVNYCGPGNSETGNTLKTNSACLNEACCRHDNCYGVQCTDRKCYWTTQTQECDDALRAVCDRGCDLDVRGKLICGTVRYLDDREDPSDRPECSLPASCVTGPDIDCVGQTCETFTTCNPGSGCNSPVCGSLAEGGGICVEGATQCLGLADCTTSADCGGDGLCFVDSCCGRAVCVPASAFCPDIGASQAVRATQAILEETTFGSCKK